MLGQGLVVFPFGKKGNEHTGRKWLPTRQCHKCPGHGRWQWGRRGQRAPGCSSLRPPALSQPDPRTHTETARWAAEQSRQGVSGQHFPSPHPWVSRPPVRQGPPQSPRSRWCCLWAGWGAPWLAPRWLLLCGAPGAGLGAEGNEGRRGDRM